MPNYIFSYDLNGAHPTHEEMDTHIEQSGWSVGRILETVWYIGSNEGSSTVTQYVTSILSENDRYVVVTAEFMQFENLLTTNESLQQAWMSYG